MSDSLFATDWLERVAASLSVVDDREWTAEPDDWRGYLRHDREEIFVRPENGSRVCLASLYPYSRTVSNPESVSITVAPTRNSDDVAKEIARRLLPEYRENLAKFLGRVELHEARVARNRGVAKLFGAFPHRDDPDSYEFERDLRYGEGFDHKIDLAVRGWDWARVDLKIEGLAPELARKVIALIESEWGQPR